MRKHRKTRRKKLRNRKNVVFLSILFCVVFLTIGYAAFQTVININVKGSIKYKTVSQLKKKVVVSGDGLYKDSIEQNVYIYRGSNPDNYIIFHNELWRIISIDSNNSLKIIKEDKLLSDMPFDTGGLRDKNSDGAGGTYCSQNTGGCNVWAKTNNYINSQYSGTVMTDSSLNVYLNTTYYDSFDELSKNYIITHDYGFGVPTYNNTDLAKQIQEENSYIWNGKIALATNSDYIRANNDVLNCGNYYLSCVNAQTCLQTNYLYRSDYESWWLITPRGEMLNYVNRVHESGVIGSKVASENSIVRPVMFLKNNIKLKGNGTELKPYEIVE